MESSTDLYVTPRRVAGPEACLFYHAMEVPGLGVIQPEAGWDLRDGVDAYLGGIEFDGRRVLEIGPASGFLTFEMERRGAEVVAVELAPDREWDFVPQAGVDIAAVVESRWGVMDELRNGFWLAHERIGSRAQVHEGSAYELPDALGRFDVALIGSILLHTRDPQQILAQCAARAEQIVVTERHWPELPEAPLARLVPTRENGMWDTWWDFTPEYFVNALELMGRDRIEVTFHTQTHVAGSVDYPMPMFTVVAS